MINDNFDLLIHPNTLKKFGNNASANDLLALGGKFSFLTYEKLVSLLQPQLFYKFIKNKSDLIKYLNALNHSYSKKNNNYLSLIEEQNFTNTKQTAFLTPCNNVVAFNTLCIGLFDKMQKAENIFFPGMIFSILIHESEHSVQLCYDQWRHQQDKSKYNFIHDTKKIDDYYKSKLIKDIQECKINNYQPEVNKEIEKKKNYINDFYFGSPCEIGAREKSLMELLSAAKTTPKNKNNMFSNLIIECMYELNSENFQYYLTKQLSFAANCEIGKVICQREIDTLSDYMSKYYLKYNLVYNPKDTVTIQKIIDWSNQDKKFYYSYPYEEVSPKLKDINETYSKLYAAEVGATIAPFKDRNSILNILSVQNPNGVQINSKYIDKASEMMVDRDKFIESFNQSK